MNEDESIDQRNSMKETIHYDFSSSLAPVSQADIEDYKKMREKLQKNHLLIPQLDLWKGLE